MAGMCFPELPAPAVGGAQKQNVDAGKVDCVGEAHSGIPEQALVHLVQMPARAAFGMHESQFRPGVVHQDADKFSCRVSGTAYDAGFNHR